MRYILIRVFTLFQMGKDKKSNSAAEQAHNESLRVQLAPIGHSVQRASFRGDARLRRGKRHGGRADPHEELHVHLPRHGQHAGPYQRAQQPEQCAGS